MTRAEPPLVSRRVVVDAPITTGFAANDADPPGGRTAPAGPTGSWSSTGWSNPRSCGGLGRAHPHAGADVAACQRFAAAHVVPASLSVGTA
jgi:hypothetical protein